MQEDLKNLLLPFSIIVDKSNRRIAYLCEMIFMIYIFLMNAQLWPINELATDHDFHISNMECNVNTQDQSVEITLRIFIDDLESALEERGHRDLKLCTAKEDSLSEVYIANYLSDKLLLSINSVKKNHVMLGKEASEDLTAVWIYLSIENQTLVKSLDIENSILLELFDDQKNIIAVKRDNQRTAHWIFDNRDTQNQVQF